MKNKTWAIRFTDRRGEVFVTETEGLTEPSLEEAAGVVVRWHRALTDQPEIIDISRLDQTPQQTALAYFKYEIVDIKVVSDPD